MLQHRVRRLDRRKVEGELGMAQDTYRNNQPTLSGYTPDPAIEAWIARLGYRPRRSTILPRHTGTSRPSWRPFASASCPPGSPPLRHHPGFTELVWVAYGDVRTAVTIYP
jgi:hypothetical protein